MARRRTRIHLNIYLNARLVGQLRRQASGAIDFQYHPDWRPGSITQPVSLSLPLREDRYTGEPVTAVFDNLLPDSEPIRRQIAERAELTIDEALAELPDDFPAPIAESVTQGLRARLRTLEQVPV